MDMSSKIIDPQCSPTATCVESTPSYGNGSQCMKPETCPERGGIRKQYQSEVSINETLTTSTCTGCKVPIAEAKHPRRKAATEHFLEYQKRARLKKLDAANGTNYYGRYMRRKNRAKLCSKCRIAKSHQYKGHNHSTKSRNIVPNTTDEFNNQDKESDPNKHIDGKLREMAKTPEEKAKRKTCCTLV